MPPSADSDAMLQETEKPRREGVAAAILVACVHLPVLFNGLIAQDDWLMVRIDGTGVPLDWLLSAGHPLLFLYTSLVSVLSEGAFLYKVLMYASTVFGAYFTSTVLGSLFGIRGIRSVAYAFLIWAYPGFVAWGLVSVSHYVISLCFFFAGWHCLSKVGLPSRIASAVLLFISMSMNSLIAVHYCFLVLNDLQSSATRQRMITARPEQYAIPLLYWLMLSYLFPREGGWAEHYGFHLDYSLISENIYNFYRFGLFEPASSISNLFNVAPSFGSILLAASAVLFGVTVYLVSTDEHGSRDFGRNLFRLVCVSIAVVAPYVAIGKAPSLHFYETRHSILLGLPLAMFVEVLVSAGGRVTESRFPAIILSLLVFAFGFVGTVQNHVFLLARWTRMLVIEQLFSKEEALSRASVISVFDDLEDPDSHLVLQRSDYLSVLDLSHIARSAWPDRPRLAFSRRHEARLLELAETDPALLRQTTTIGQERFDMGGDYCHASLSWNTEVTSNLELAGLAVETSVLGIDIAPALLGLAQLTVDCRPLPPPSS